jgi:hypothetical protein
VRKHASSRVLSPVHILQGSSMWEAQGKLN